MLRRVLELSLRFRGAVLGLAVAVLGFGGYVGFHAKLDVLPEFAPPQAEIQTEAPGFSAEEVELLVTRPIEAAVQGRPGSGSCAPNRSRGCRS